MTEEQFRSSIVSVAETWIGTPYKLCGRIKGVGVNCAQLLFAVALEAGVIPVDAPEPRWYTPQLATHSKEERLLHYIRSYGAVDIEENQVKPGDIVLYKTGLSHGHAGIVLKWPTEIVHCLPPRGCQKGGVDDGRLHRYSRVYLTLWRGV